MKYGHIIIMAMAVLMSTACSQGSDLSEPNGGVPVVETQTTISFNGQQEEERVVSRGTSRRAGIPLSETATQFKVWGYKNMSYSAGSYGDLQTVFPGYIVNWSANSAASTTSNSNGWEYVNQQTSGDEQTIKYWDWSAAAYRFFAVTGTNTDYTDYAESGIYGVSYETVYFTMTANASPVRDGEGTAEQKIAANIAETPYFTRLWFSTGNVADYPDKQFGKPVQLEFLKPYARVRFLFNYSYESEGIKLKNPKFKPTDGTKKINLKGTFKVIYPLKGTTTSEWYSVTDIDQEVGLVEFDKQYIPEGGVEREVWYTVLPIDPSMPQGSYTLTVNVNGADKTCVVPAQYMQWKPGFSYTYIFKITDDGGVEIDMVQSAFTPWEERESQEYEIYNW